MITHLEQMIEAAKAKARKRIVVACANDNHSIEAVHHAMELGIVDATLVGDEATIVKVCKDLNIQPEKFRIVQESDEQKAAHKAVELIVKGEGDILMKGLVTTDKYMRAILNKDAGLLPPKAILSHVTVIENPNYEKLLIVGDVAIIPVPDLDQKIAITNYLIQTAHRLGNEKPKVAIIAATEQMLPNMPTCVDAAIISKMGERGQIKGALIEGPLALDTAIDKESAAIKKLKSEVAGDADCLLFPNIETGNVFYKFNTKLAKGELGAIVIGAKCPAVLSSRGDSALTKTYSIALAALSTD
ncbi:MAG TPA: phosphate acyltransferase [Bacteroidales bacterium]|jgi:phosphate butyryltransferase|nr:phosphate butyryltransferase [Bacteroidales bacterium]MDI9573140.1 phosphate acyltransferase [Bacteroidota bacterium]OQC60236.1 MAG: Phosphate acetyltransferase [Bacteroidetes bacterium ADurb.Bin012]MBP9511543.1 phosphate butyryltransferase [Bacteroidales bacterium]MBP9588252.1 phosphate butyryltransferase [Bacteroidales bacterium]